MKKIFIFPVVLFVVIMLIIYLNFSYLNPYNTELFHPMFSVLLPLTILLFLCIFLKNIKPKFVLLTIAIFGVLDFLLLSTVDPLCSQIVCIDRSQTALFWSSLFSFIYFIILLFQNRKKSGN
jgi:hypothetical protein